MVFVIGHQKCLEVPSHNVRLFKLHGSVNWFLFEPPRRKLEK